MEGNQEDGDVEQHQPSFKLFSDDDELERPLEVGASRGRKKRRSGTRFRGSGRRNRGRGRGQAPVHRDSHGVEEIYVPSETSLFNSSQFACGADGVLLSDSHNVVSSVQTVCIDAPPSSDVRVDGVDSNIVRSNTIPNVLNAPVFVNTTVCANLTTAASVNATFINGTRSDGNPSSSSVHLGEVPVHASEFPLQDRSSQDLVVHVAHAIVPSSSEFLDLDQEDFNSVQNGDESNSYRNERWCINRFNAWRRHMNIATDIPVEKIPLQELGVILSKFFLMVCKVDGSRYPTESIKNLLMSFNRIILREQKTRINLTGNEEVEFNIQRHPWFVGACRAVQKAMTKSKDLGANKPRRKVDPLTYEQEKLILAHPLHQVTSAHGIHKRMAFYCFIVFLIRGNTELWKVMVKDFTIEVDQRGREFLKYDERTSKNHKVTLSRFQEEHFRRPVVSFDPDVVATFRALLSHMPSNSEHGHLFLAAIVNPRSNIWFRSGINVGESAMRNWMRQMCKTVGLVGDFTNKSGRVTAISRMSAGMVPRKAIASVTGHRDEKTLERYDRTLQLQQNAAQALCREPYDEDGNPLTYEDHYRRQMEHYHAHENVPEDSTSELPPSHGSGIQQGFGGRLQIRSAPNQVEEQNFVSEAFEEDVHNTSENDDEIVVCPEVQECGQNLDDPSILPPTKTGRFDSTSHVRFQVPPTIPHASAFRPSNVHSAFRPVASCRPHVPPPIYRPQAAPLQRQFYTPSRPFNHVYKPYDIYRDRVFAPPPRPMAPYQHVQSIGQANPGNIRTGCGNIPYVVTPNTSTPEAVWLEYVKECWNYEWTSFEKEDFSHHIPATTVDAVNLPCVQAVSSGQCAQTNDVNQVMQDAERNNQQVGEGVAVLNPVALQQVDVPRQADVGQIQFHAGVHHHYNIVLGDPISLSRVLENIFQRTGRDGSGN